MEDNFIHKLVPTRLTAGIIGLFLVAGLLGLYIVQHVQKYPDTFLNKDEYYHISLIKNIVESNDDNYFGVKYWEVITYNYPPLFPVLHATIIRGLGKVDIVAYAKWATFITFVSVLCVFSILVWKISKSLWAVNLALLFLISSYFPMNRLTLFLPENVALVFLLLFVVLMIGSGFSRWVRYPVMGIVMFLTLLTNILTATFVFTLAALWVPVCLIRRQYRDALNTTLIVGIVLAIASQITILETFWVQYFLRAAPIAVIASMMIIASQLIIRRNSARRKVVAAIYSLLVLLSLLLLYLDWVGARTVWNNILSERYYKLDDIARITHSYFRFYFFSNGNTHVGLNSILFLMGIGGLVVSVRKIMKGQTHYTPIVLMTLISFASLVVGPYVGIEPGSENPRAMLYFAVMNAILAGILSHFILKNHFLKNTMAVILVALVTTTTNNVVRFVNLDSTDNIPKQIVDFINQHVTDERRLSINSQYVMELYSRTHVRSTAFAVESGYRDKSDHEVELEALRRKKVGYVLLGPVSGIKETVETPLADSLKLNDGKYNLYELKDSSPTL